MVRFQFACLAFASIAGAVLAAAQLPQPAAEPGSVPEHQSAAVQSGPGGVVRPIGPVRISGGVIAGLRLSGDQPVYPPDAKAQGISGSVVMHAIIGKDGHVQGLTVVSGNEMLARAALDAVKTWVYRPYLLNGEPTEVDTTINVNFNLSTPPVDPDAGPPLMREGRTLPRVGGSILQGMRLSSVPPVYPAEAKAAHVQGTVVLQVVVGKGGNVEETNVVSGPPELTQAAIDAVKQWRYKSYLLDGEPVELQSTVTIHFNLAD